MSPQMLPEEQRRFEEWKTKFTAMLARRTRDIVYSCSGCGQLAGDDPHVVDDSPPRLYCDDCWPRVHG